MDYQGKISIKSKKIAYVEQEPYIFSGTIEKNILFGKKMD
jgi:ABC-type multidrug transport system fused ATPase/permease subunit